MLKTEIPYSTVVEFVEYLDVYEAISEQKDLEAQEKIKAQQQGK